MPTGNGTLTSFIIANAFYNGPSLNQTAFEELLSIPTTSMSVGPLSYLEVSNTLVDTPAPGAQLYGASAVTSDVDAYLNAFEQFTNFTQTFQSELALALLAFTPVLDTQILASRSRGGNPMDPPLGGYNAIQFEVAFPPGVTTVSNDLEQGRQLFFKK
jgi:hypothetical protein